MTNCAEPFIGQFSIWKCRQDGREVIVLSSNSSWIHVKGLESGKRTHVDAAKFTKQYTECVTERRERQR